MITSLAALPALVGFTLRGCLPLRRRLGLLALGVVAVLYGLLATLLQGAATTDFARVAALALFGLVLPLVGLVAGDAVLGAEIRRGSFHFTWLSPVPAWTVALGRWVGGCVIAIAIVAPSFALSAVVAGAPEAAVAAALAGAAGVAAYIALFLCIGTLVRRAPVLSLALVFIGERLLGTALTGIAQLTPMWEARALFVGIAPDAGGLVREGIPGGWAALGRLALIAAVTLAVAAVRLPRMRLTTAATD